MKKAIISIVLTVCIFITICGLYGQASLPTSYAWDPSTSLPTGWTASGMGTPYTSGHLAANSGKFDSTGDNLVIYFSSSASSVDYWLKGNPSSGSATVGTFLVQESTDGTIYSTIRTITDKDNTWQEYTDYPAAGSRYIKFLYSVKTSGNIAIDEVLVSATAAAPSISVTPSILSGFNYMYGSGPSGEMSFLITGTNLIEDLIVSSVSTDYEIASTSGGSFGTTLSYTPISGGVSETVYVRLKSGLNIGLYHETINCSSGTVIQTVSCNGFVNPIPPSSGIEFDFEGVGEEKTSYTSGTVTLSGYDCDMTQALIGNQDGDVKFGLRAARLRYDQTTATYGSLTMLDQKSNGIGTISLYYSRANFSGDRTGVSPVFVVEYTTDAKVWIQAGDETDLDGVDIPTLFTAEVNQTGAFRVRIRQTAGDSGKRWNVDNIQITDYEGNVPVELSSFTAVLTAENFVKLSWTTQTETNVQGYYIYRASSDALENAILISSLVEATNTSEEHTYRFTDSELFEEGTYYYWLQNVDFSGSTEYHGPVSVVYSAANEGVTPEIPQVTGLKDIYPNPFNPTAIIPFSIAKTADVQLMVYNARGQLLRHVNFASKAPGNYQFAWDGKDANGTECGSGVYYFVLQAGKDSFQRKAVLQK